LPNYDLTFSRSESNDHHCDTVLRRGGRVAMVFADTDKALPADHKPHGTSFEYANQYWRTWDGDASDLRFLDPKNGIVVLKAKGQGKRDQSGFVL